MEVESHRRIDGTTDGLEAVAALRRERALMKPGPTNLDRGIAGFPPDVRPILERVRSAIRKAVPGVKEAIASSRPFKAELEPYEVNGKGTIRFPLALPVPVKLIASLAKFRAKEAAE